MKILRLQVLANSGVGFPWVRAHGPKGATVFVQGHRVGREMDFWLLPDVLYEIHQPLREPVSKDSDGQEVLRDEYRQPWNRYYAMLTDAGELKKLDRFAVRRVKVQLDPDLAYEEPFDWFSELGKQY